MKFSKQILFSTLALSLTLTSFSQSKKQWNPNKYVWSYTQANKVSQSKLPIDFTTIDNWQQMSSYLTVSNDGRYFAYGIERVGASPSGRKRQDSLVIQATDDSGWRFVFAGADWLPGFFAANNKEYILQRKDSLYFLQLGSREYKIISNVQSNKPLNETNEWVAYQLKLINKPVILMNLLTRETKQFENTKSYVFDKANKWFVCETNQPDKQLLVYNLQTGKEQRFLNVKSYFFSPADNKLIVNTGTEIQYHNFNDQTNKTIYSFESNNSDEVSNFQFDVAEKQVIFKVKDTSNKSPVNSIWYYKEGMTNAVNKVNPQSLGLAPGQTIASASFSDNGQYLNITLPEKSVLLQSSSNDVQLDVWSYKDMQLQTTQANSLINGKHYNVIVSIEDSQVKWMETKDEQLILLQGNYALLNRNNSEKVGDRFWEKSKENNRSTWLITLRDGKRISLPAFSNFWFSPSGRYLVYFDSKQAYNYFSYDLLTGKTVNISSGVTTELNESFFEHPYGVTGWIENDEGLLVYDSCDIWQLDLTGQKKASNITKGYGVKNNIILRLFHDEKNERMVPILKSSESLLLISFHATNKTQGIYRAKLGATMEPELLTSGAWSMKTNGDQKLGVTRNGLTPVKALHADTRIVQRESSTDAANYYATRDFKSFKNLTNLQPQRGYKWLTEELHTFSHINGQASQGILYKPTDFDSSKKYPVLLVFYNRFSNNMHIFPTPEYNMCATSPGYSPVWFTNNGYLVFTPDKLDMYGSNNVGAETYNVIEGAANYLKSLPYVDGNGLGCASHSLSAKLGAYIFTHSKSFSATAISEGFLYGNMINVALSVGALEKSKLEMVENMFYFGNLWKNRDAWIDQTTVLNVHKASSPLLLFCNKQSFPEYIDQTQQLMISLWRLDKKAWWLKYDKGAHTLGDPDELKDYTIRYTQYFDHYLKKGPAPRWMTQGIPNALRGVETRFELDPSGTCDLPNKKECHICQAWNKQYNRNPPMFEKEIKDWALDKDIKAELDKKQAEERKRLDKEGAVETKRILGILKNGYQGDNKAKVKNQK